MRDSAPEYWGRYTTSNIARILGTAAVKAASSFSLTLSIHCASSTT